MRYTRKKYKKFLFQFLGMVVLFAILIGSFSYIVDPLQFYHKASFYTPKLSWQERYQNPGLARNYEYDTIVLGSSMTENFLPSEVGEKLNGDVLKLSIEGSTIGEQSSTAQVAFRTGQVKQVLWGIDYFAFRNNNTTGNEDFPAYLYDTNPLNDYKYVFNESNIKSALTALSESPGRSNLQLSSLERLYNWDKAVTYGRDLVIKNWGTARNNEVAYGNNEDPLESVKQTFDDNVVSIVAAHPETKFYLYYPPYSILRQQIWYKTNPGRYANQLEMKRYMFEKLQPFSNVSIYDFQADSSITYDLDQYKDLSHHSGAINSLIVDEISKGTHKVTADNLESGIQLLKLQAENVIVNTEAGTVYSINASLNGEPQSFGFLPPATGEVIMAPLKPYAQMLGIAFDYNIDKKLITLAKGDQVAELTVGSDQALLDGQPVQLAAPVENKIGIMAAPLESIPALFGGTVTFGKEQDKLLDVDITIGQ